MRNFMSAFSIIILLQGCSVISREAGYPGGNVGYLADRHALFARGQDQQVNRYYVTLALLAPFVAETVQGSTEAKLSAERITDLYGNINKLRIAAGKCALPNLTENSLIRDVKIDSNRCSKEDAGSLDGSALSFESLSFEVNKSLSDALKQAFDNLNIRVNATRIIALEPTEILKTVLKARHLVPVLMRYLSSYRDITIVFGFSVAESCNVALKPRVGGDVDAKAEADRIKKLPTYQPCGALAASFIKLIDRNRTADAEVAGDERPIRAVYKAGENALNAGLDWKISKLHRVALLHHVNRACKKLDALAKIDYPKFKGCTISFKGKTLKDSNQDAQKAVDEIIVGDAL